MHENFACSLFFYNNKRFCIIDFDFAIFSLFVYLATHPRRVVNIKRIEKAPK